MFTQVHSVVLRFFFNFLGLVSSSENKVEHFFFLREVRVLNGQVSRAFIYAFLVSIIS